MMEAAGSSQLSVLTGATRRHILEDESFKTMPSLLYILEYIGKRCHVVSGTDPRTNAPIFSSYELFNQIGCICEEASGVIHLLKFEWHTPQ
jgi:hypothetical protein